LQSQKEGEERKKKVSSKNERHSAPEKITGGGGTRWRRGRKGAKLKGKRDQGRMETTQTKR